VPLVVVAVVAAAVEMEGFAVVAVVVWVPVTVGRAYWVHYFHRRNQSLQCKNSSVYNATTV
jgi:hypothetical protein